MSSDDYRTAVEFTGDLDHYGLVVKSDGHSGSTGHGRRIAEGLRALADRIEDDVMHAEDQASLS